MYLLRDKIIGIFTITLEKILEYNTRNKITVSCINLEEKCVDSCLRQTSESDLQQIEKSIPISNEYESIDTILDYEGSPKNQATIH